MIYKDRYGLYWFTAPIRGVVLPDGSWVTTLNAGSISRPGSTVVASEHTHPKGTYDPTGSGTTNGGDNQSDHPMFVIKGDDTVWYFPPNTERALLYGVIKDGKVQTKYTTGSDNQIDLSQDPYKMAATSNTAGSSDFSWVDFATAVSVVIGTATLITLLAVFGSPSTGGNIPDGSTVVPDPFNTMCITYPSVCYP